MKNFLKLFKWIGTIFTIMFGGMAGGQGKTLGKSPRRIGIPIFSYLTAIAQNGFSWKWLSFLLFFPLLSTGYGVDSFLGNIIGVEWLIRLVYALLLSVPFYFFSWRRGAIASVLLAIAFQIHAGSLGYVSWFGDVLIEDMVRYGILGILVSFNIFIPTKK